EFVRVDGHRLADIAARQDLDLPIGTGDESALPQQVGRDDGAGVELRIKRVEIHNLVLDPEWIVEAALRHAAVQRHLAAFEPSLELEPGPRLRALVPAPRGLAVAGALAAADPLLGVLHPLRGTQIAETHDYSPPIQSVTSTR